jgi:hypothetical protein
MTEQEWLVCAEPQKMLHFMWWREVSDRKLRLFAVACCRRIWHLLIDKGSREAVEVAERYADSRATDEELEAASYGADSVWKVDMERASKEGKWDRRSRLPYYGASAAAYNVAIPLGWWGAAPAFVAPDEIAREVSTNRETESLAQCALLRDIFGNPFRQSPTFSPTVLSWDDGTVRHVAEVTYEERRLPEGMLDNTRLAILADALEEAGCTDQQVLMHLRGGGDHYCGCWVIDLLLGKR